MTGMSFARQTTREKLVWAIDQALENENAKLPPKTYHAIGASRLGHECVRAIQYEYLRTSKGEGSAFSGQTLRIFARGHIFEDMMAGWLRKAGFILRTHDQYGKQFGFAVAGGKLKGFCDGVFVGGPAIYQYPALWECKALGSKSWKRIAKEKLKGAPEYCGQMALYQAYLNLSDNPGVFTAINSDTMDIYEELVPFDPAEAQRLSDRAVNIIQASEAGEWLPRVAQQSDFYLCTYCDYQDICWR